MRLLDASVSVVIPCFNAAPYLRATLESALAQTHRPLEIIVVDDGSTDGSAGIAASYGSPVRVLRQPNRGESAARNRAMDVARGAWIATLDADDVREPRKLAVQFAALEKANEDIVCVYSDFHEFGERIGTRVIRRPRYDVCPDYRVQMLLDWCVHPLTTIFPTPLGRRVRFPEDIRHSEDQIFFLELRDAGRFLYIPEALANYRRRDGQQTALPDHLLRGFESRYAWFAKNVARYSEIERRRVLAAFADQLVEIHDQFLARYRNHMVRACRCAVCGDASRGRASRLFSQARLPPRPHAAASRNAPRHLPRSVSRPARRHIGASRLRSLS